MWAFFTTIKMKNIGNEKATKELIKLMKKCDGNCTLIKSSTNYLKFVSYDVFFYESAFELFSRKYKNQMLAVSTVSIHNPYSRQPERFEDIYWNYYKDGKEILRYVRTNKGINLFYKVKTKVTDYDKLVLEGTVKDIIRFYGDSKDTLKFFNIKDLKKKNSKVRVLYYDYIYKYGKEVIDGIFGDVEGRKEKKITKQEFISNFDKKELLVFKRDFITKKK